MAVDIQVRKKKRAKIQKLIAERLAASPGLSEAAAKKEVMRELRAEQKAKRATGRTEVEEIENRVRREMEGKEPAAIR
jgi:hypothetical protein